MDVERGGDGSIVVSDLKEARSSRYTHGIKTKKPLDFRTNSEIDRDRILYSRYIKRMAGVSQIVSPSLDAKQTHSRLTHSLKVSNLAGEIANDIARRAWMSQTDPDSDATGAEWFRSVVALGGLDIAACSAAGLAHDIGHAPFGHAAERVLNSWIVAGDPDSDGFEGNAQSFRTVCSLDHRSHSDTASSLDLSAVTLSAMMKYPVGPVVEAQGAEPSPTTAETVARLESNRPPKFGYYSAEYPQFQFSRKAVPADLANGTFPSVEACIMDIADDITYAMHDLQDFLELGVMNIEIMSREIKEGFLAIGRGEHNAHDVGDNDNAIVRLANYLDATEIRWNEEDFVKALHQCGTWLDGMREIGHLRPGSILRAATIRGFVSKRIKMILAGIRVVDVSESPGSNSLTAVTSLPTKNQNNDGEVEIPIDEIDLDGRVPVRVVYLESVVWHQVQILKWMTVAHVISSPGVSIHERAQTAALTIVLDGLADMVSSRRVSILPSPLREFVKSSDRSEGDLRYVRRAVADYVCSITDDSCLELASYFSGAAIPDFVSFR